MKKINYEEMSKLQEDLESWTEYIPLELIPYANDKYWQKRTNEAKRKYREKRQGITGNVEEYLLNDIIEWVEQYPQFNYILIDGE